MKSLLHWRWCKENDRNKNRREMFRVTSQSTMEAEKEVVGSIGDTKRQSGSLVQCSKQNGGPHGQCSTKEYSSTTSLNTKHYPIRLLLRNHTSHVHSWCWPCVGFARGKRHACLGGHCVDGLAQVRGTKGSIE